MEFFGDCTLYLITDRSLSRGRSTADVVREAVAGGVDVVQLRNKEEQTADVVLEGLRVHEITERHGVPLIVNDRIDVALAIEAEGAHVGQTDLPVPLARKLMPRPALLGVSTSSVDMAICAQQQLADYIGYGPIYRTGTKETAASPRGTGMIHDVLKAIDIPLVALGGISSRNVSNVVAAGADHVAVCSAIVAAEDVRRAASTLKESIVRAQARRQAP